jgi:transposase InsO family protein
MAVAGLQARQRRRRLPTDTGTRAADAIAPNVLERRFEAPGPNQRWVADFTYIWTSEGWLYVAVVLDLFSRRVGVEASRESCCITPTKAASTRAKSSSGCSRSTRSRAA